MLFVRVPGVEPGLQRSGRHRLPHASYPDEEHNTLESAARIELKPLGVCNPADAPLSHTDIELGPSRGLRNLDHPVNAGSVPITLQQYLGGGCESRTRECAVQRRRFPTSLIPQFGASGEIRTLKPFGATPSRWCVYQFRHRRIKLFREVASILFASI
jgi:hypothetical protein